MTEIPFREAREDLPEDLSNVIGQVDVCFIVDTTGSMAPFLHEARKHAREVADRVAQEGGLDIRYAVVEYRDHPPQDKTFVTRSHAFGDADALTRALDSLEAAGGGDRPEAVWDGVVEATRLRWRPQAERLAFLVGDSPPHDNCCQLTKDIVIESLNNARIHLDAHSIAGFQDTGRAFKALSDATNGKFSEVAVEHIDHSTRRYEETLVTASATASDSRLFASTASAMRRAGRAATPRAVGETLGWDAARTTGTVSGLSSRGIVNANVGSGGDILDAEVDFTVTGTVPASNTTNVLIPDAAPDSDLMDAPPPGGDIFPGRRG